jgi:hypothetical protein
VTAAPGASHLIEKEASGDLMGKDKFRMTHPNTDWNTALIHGEKINAGTLSYKLIRI